MNAGRIAASACKAARVVSHVSRPSLLGRSHCVHRVDIKQLSRCFNSKIPPRRLGDNPEAISGQSSAPETSTGALHGQSPPYRNRPGFAVHHVGPDARRSLIVIKFPRFAIEDDIRELFGESGFYPDRIHMVYDYLGRAEGYIIVVMSSPEEADRAMHELNGAPLYTKRVNITLYRDMGVGLDGKKTMSTRGSYPLTWGWYANKSNSLKDIRLRYPRTTPPHGVFDAHRESRSVAIIWDKRLATDEANKLTYGLLHVYDILAVYVRMFYDSTAEKSERSMSEVIFATTEAAEIVCHTYDRTVLHGSKIRVGLRKPTTRILGGSWEASHNRAHYQPRDLGSAKGTNLEKEEEDMFRKWLMGDQDRGLYVAGHKY